MNLCLNVVVEPLQNDGAEILNITLMQNNFIKKNNGRFFFEQKSQQIKVCKCVASVNKIAEH